MRLSRMIGAISLATRVRCGIFGSVILFKDAP